jgi:ubiquinol-cytochrome c reductase cytochrome b subunit
MDAWSQDTVPVKYLQNLTPVQRQGAVIFQGMQCRNCHSLDDIGGRRGPMLDDVAVRLTEDQLIRQVVQGGGNMPAYGKNLSPPQVTALVKFLETLHPPNQRPARDASLSVENTVAPGSKSLGAARQGGSGETLEPPSKPLSNEDKK